MRRHLSLHIGSRWYRAPEICLVEKHYDQASDMWGVGCIIYELLNYYFSFKQSNIDLKDWVKSRFLFKGNSCFPLSPCSDYHKNKKADKNGSNIINKAD